MLIPFSACLRPVAWTDFGKTGHDFHSQTHAHTELNDIDILDTTVVHLTWNIFNLQTQNINMLFLWACRIVSSDYFVFL